MVIMAMPDRLPGATCLAYERGRLHEETKQPHGGDRKSEGAKSKDHESQKRELLIADTTADKLAAQFGTSTATIKRAEAEERRRVGIADERNQRQAPPNPEGANQYSEKRLDERNDSAHLTNEPAENAPPKRQQNNEHRTAHAIAKKAGVSRAGMR